VWARRTRAVAFTPSDLTGLEVWYDPSDISTLWQDSARTTSVTTDADPVGALDDKSGNGRHATQATSGKRPTYKTSQFGSLSALDLDGTDDFLDATVTLSQPLTWFIVTDLDATATQQHLIDGNTNRNTVYVWTDGDFHFYAGSDVDSALAVDTSPHVIVATFNGASSKLWVDGGSGVTGDTSTQGISSLLRIGIESGGSSGPVNGRIGELLGYTQALSTTDIDRAGNYLAAKWGTTWSAAS
jgi:hypothetical protein